MKISYWRENEWSFLTHAHGYVSREKSVRGCKHINMHLALCGCANISTRTWRCVDVQTYQHASGVVWMCKHINVRPTRCCVHKEPAASMNPFKSVYVYVHMFSESRSTLCVGVYYSRLLEFVCCMCRHTYTLAYTERMWHIYYCHNTSNTKDYIYIYTHNIYVYIFIHVYMYIHVYSP